MPETWDEYVIRRRAEGWRWGWESNDQIKTDPAMQPPIGEPFARDHEPIEINPEERAMSTQRPNPNDPIPQPPPEPDPDEPEEDSKKPKETR